MNMNELAERIHLPREALEILAHEIEENDYRSAKALFYEDMEQFIAAWKEKSDRYAWALRFYCRIAAEIYGEYKWQGIEDTVFDQTFYDITIWCRECHRKYGEYGIDEIWWIGQSAKMKLFRLGRLQFEPDDEKGVLNVHIPAGEPLNALACKESFEQAESFFDEKYKAYVCESWLLSPRLKELLPGGSNILLFQQLFEIQNISYEYPQAEERIFGEILEQKENYPEDTSLRKIAKQYILSGNDIGIGHGFIYR